MRRLLVRPSASGTTYPIQVGRGAARRLAPSLVAKPIGDRYAVVTDHTVRDLYGEGFLSRLHRAGMEARLFSFAPGESRKNLKTLEMLSNRMLRAGFSRTDAVIALGGGVVGDVAGLIAASYMRGVPYVQVPTTLLAMVDSSIGGKVAVDLPDGKNIVGHFWHPSRVLIDPNFLETLPVRERRNGWVEIVKHGVIADRDYFGWMERHAGQLVRLKGRALEGVLATSLRIKARVVGKDEREADLRRVLNYGHTIGHAIETITRYRRYSHGEAVAIGMNVEGRIARELGYWRDDDLKRQNRLLRQLGLRIRFPDLPIPAVLRALRRDKKVAHGEVVFALPRRIGAMRSEQGRFGLRVASAAVKQAIREAAI